jgi:hypothetical protein
MVTFMAVSFAGANHKKCVRLLRRMSTAEAYLEDGQCDDRRSALTDGRAVQ